MYRLNVNKTKLYKLAKSFWPEIEPMRQTEFIKFHRVRDYGMKFRSGTYYHNLFLACCGGGVLLADDWSVYDDDCNETTGRETHRLSWDMLQKFELLKEIPDLRREN